MNTRTRRGVNLEKLKQKQTVVGGTKKRCKEAVVKKKRNLILGEGCKVQTNTATEVIETDITYKEKSCEKDNFPVLEKSLLEWLKKRSSEGAVVSVDTVKSKAFDLAQELNCEVADDWILHFWECNKDCLISDDKPIENKLSFLGSTESNSCENVKDQNDTIVFDEKLSLGCENPTLVQLTKEYKQNDIFAADEIGIFYNCLPNNMEEFKGNCENGENSEDRITVLLATNMTGTEKLNLLVIGKHKEPKSFDGIENLPVDYAANKKVWMTKEIFEDWIRNLDQCFLEQKRKVIIFVKKCSAHNDISNLSCIRLEYFPCSCEHNIDFVKQPIMQGISQQFKKNYRLGLLQKMFSSQESGKMCNMNLLQTVYLLDSAWSRVSLSMIIKCFSTAGFAQQGSTDTGAKIEIDEWDPLTDSVNRNPDSFDSLPTFEMNLTTNIDSYVTFDDDLATSKKISHEHCLNFIPDLSSFVVPLDQSLGGFNDEALNIAMSGDFEVKLDDLIGFGTGNLMSLPYDLNSSSASSSESDSECSKEGFSSVFFKKLITNSNQYQYNHKPTVKGKILNNSKPKQNEKSKAGSQLKPPKNEQNEKSVTENSCKMKVGQKRTRQPPESETKSSNICSNSVKKKQRKINGSTVLENSHEDGHSSDPESSLIPSHDEAISALKTLQAYLTNHDREGVFAENFVEINRFIHNISKLDDV